MHRALAVLALALLMVPAALAEEPSDAGALWTEQYGGGMVESVQFAPMPVYEGALPTASIRFLEGHNVSDVSGQYCRISGPTGGATCFRAGLLSTLSADGRTWLIDLADQGNEPFAIPVPVAGERLGVQFFVTFDDGNEVAFPQGLPHDHPWFFGSEEEFLKWDETQYFAFNTLAEESEPASLAWLPWVAIPTLVILGGFTISRRSKGLTVILAIALAIPAGVTIWDASTEAAKAPDFTLTDTGWENGEYRGPQEFSLSDYEGKTVVLDLMAYNCAACRIVTEHVMDPLWQEYGERDDFVILTVDVGEFSNFPGSSLENLIRWQTEEYDSPWIHALDTEGIFLDYVKIGALGLPSMFILDAERDVVFANTGTPNKDDMAAIIEQSFEGQAMEVNVLTVGILGLALVAGISSFFAPCSVGLIPAYMGFLLQRQHKQGASTIPAGLATAAGIVSLYGVLAIILWLFQDFLGALLPVFGPVVGGLLVVLGILMFVGFDWERVAKLFGMGKVDGRRGFFAFGVGYGLAAFGCTGPIFLPILIAGFTQSTFMGFMAFAVFTLAVASLVVFAAYLVGAGKQTKLNAILSKTKLITRVSAVLLILAGAYLIWFDLSAFIV